jgi:hypothetical protein
MDKFTIAQMRYSHFTCERIHERKKAFAVLADQDFKTVRFSLAGMPCARPVSVSLRTAPRFFYTLTIPK